MAWKPKLKVSAPKLPAIKVPEPIKKIVAAPKAVAKAVAPAQKAVAKAVAPAQKVTVDNAKKAVTKNVKPVVNKALEPAKSTVNLIKKPSMENLKKAANTHVANPINLPGKIITGKDYTVNNPNKTPGKSSGGKPIPPKSEMAPKPAAPKPAAPKPAAPKPAAAPKPGAPTGVPGSNPNDLNHWGINRPTRFETINPDGTAKSQYQVDYKNERAMSPWAKMMQANETGRFNAAKSDVLASSMAGATSGMNSMARQGGLTGGARVALMNQANQGAIGAQQNLANQYQGRMSGIATDDITRQQTIDERNANTSLGQVDKDFGAKFDVYSEMLKKNASDYMADAIGGGKKNSEVGLGGNAKNESNIATQVSQPVASIGTKTHEAAKKTDPLKGEDRTIAVAQPSVQHSQTQAKKGGGDKWYDKDLGGQIRKILPWNN